MVISIRHGHHQPARCDPPHGADARERILSTAYTLFCRNGIRAVGVDTIIERSGVAKMTVYRLFRSKDALVLAVLERREELWTRKWLEGEVRRRADAPADRLLAIFDVFDAWFRKRKFEGCSCQRALEINDRKHPIHIDFGTRWPASARSSELDRCRLDDPDALAAKAHMRRADVFGEGASSPPGPPFETSPGDRRLLLAVSSCAGARTLSRSGTGLSADVPLVRRGR